MYLVGMTDAFFLFFCFSLQEVCGDVVVFTDLMARPISFIPSPSFTHNGIFVTLTHAICLFLGGLKAVFSMSRPVAGDVGKGVGGLHVHRPSISALVES